MGYIEEFNKIMLGGYLQYIKPSEDKNSTISQTVFSINGGHNRSIDGYGNGIGFNLSLIHI